MAWWDDVGNAVASGLSAVGDAVEGVVDTVVETAQDVADVAQDVVDEVGTGARDWVSANTDPALTGLVNVAFGIGGGLLDFGFDAVGIGLRLVGDVGHLAADGWRLDLPGMLGDLANIGIGTGEAVVAVVRLGSGGYFAGAIMENVERDRALAFVDNLIRTEFDKDEAERILDRLGFGTVRPGLRVPVDWRVLRMDSASYPLAADHAAGVFDLFALAGVLSFDSFRINRERTRVVIVGADGSDQWYLPVGRSVIQSFLDTGSPRLRVYAWQNHAASRAMRFARRTLRQLLVRVDFGAIERFSRFQAANVVDITNASEFAMHDDTRYFDLGRFLVMRTVQDGSLRADLGVTALGAFRFARTELNGIAAGVRIRRSDEADSACPGDDASLGCITEVRRTEADYDAPGPNATGDPTTPTGRGVLHRDTFPPYFSEIVLAHELGHHFGLAHAGHDGLQNIMFATEQDWWDGGMWKYWSEGEASFTARDVQDVWRFVVHRLPHLIGG